MFCFSLVIRKLRLNPCAFRFRKLQFDDLNRKLRLNSRFANCVSRNRDFRFDPDQFVTEFNLRSKIL